MCPDCYDYEAAVLARSQRRVGLGYDDKIMTGWGSMARTAEEAEAVIERLNLASGQVLRT